MDLEACQSQLHLLSLKYKDVAKWTITSSGCYSCAATYNEIRVKELEVDRWKFLWFQLAIPRHSFIGWLAIKNKLTTTDRLAKWGYTGDTLGVFCRSCIESKDPHSLPAILLEESGLSVELVEALIPDC